MIHEPAARGEARDRHATSMIPDGRLAGRPLLLMFDVDGTLAPIAEHPSLARVPDATQRLIASLVTKPNVSIALVSGRAAHDARRLVGVQDVWTIGNHGAEVMTPDGDVSVDPDIERYAGQVARAAQSLSALLEPLRGVFLEDKTWTFSVHYRAADAGVLPRLRAVVDDVATQQGLRVTEGKKVLEVRPPVSVDKGTAVYTLARELGALADGASLLFAGDDATDEDAFRLLRAQHPGAVTIRVGTTGETAAEFTLDDPNAVRELLERISRTLDPNR
jgi:trehalose-phosphatase